MVAHRTVCWALVAALGLVAPPRISPAQEPAYPYAPSSARRFPPPEPIPVQASDPEAVVLPPYVSPFDCASPWCGWYTGAEAAVLWPSADIHFTGTGRLDLGATVSPRVWLGYRFEQGGSVRLTYRNLISSGDNLVSLTDGGQQDIHLRTDVHWLDLDYVSPDHVFLGSGRFAWEAGGRFTFRELGARATDASGTISTDTSYFGGGPHLGMDAAWLFGDSGWAFFSKVDGALTFGGETSHAHFHLSDPWFPGIGSLPRRHRSEVEGDMTFKVGLSWARTYSRGWLRLDGGLQVDGMGFGSKDRDNFPFRSVGAAGPFLGMEIGF
jgi:hypothetical protein